MRPTFGKTLMQGIWTPAAVLLLGSLSIGLLIWTDRINEKQRADYVVNGALMNVQIHTSMFHLGLDEFMGGNPDVDIKSIWKEFEAAMSLTNSVLNGGEIEHGVLVEPFKNPGMRAQAEDIKAALTEMREVALERLKEPAESGIASDVNQRLEKVFEVVLTRAAGLERIIEAERLRNQKNARHLFFGILSVWTLIVIVAVLGLWSRELRRKMAEATLRETEQKLRNILEHSTNLFYMHGTDHVFTYVSPQSRRFFDCEPEEAMIRWTELITDNPVNLAAIEATQRAIDTGEPQPPYMVECIGKMGRIIWVEVNESPIVKDGRTVAIVGSLTDITERKRAVEALRESEQRFASFMLHMPAAAWMKDMQGRFVYANAETARAFSTPLTELLGKTDWDFFPPEIARQFAENDCRVLSEGGSLETIEVLRQADGIEHYSIVSKFAVNGPDGKPAYIAGVAFDITERRRLEEERSRLAAIVENSDDAIIAKTLDGIIVDWNKGAEKLYGYMASEIKGRHISILVPADRVDEVTQILERIGRGESAEHIETMRVTKDGRPIPVSLAISPIKDTSGKITGASSIAHDITERKRAEHALRESEERLHLAIESTGLGTFDYYPRTGTMIWSEGIKRHFGLPADKPVDFGVFLAGLHPDDRERVDGIIQELLNPVSGGEYNTEYRTIGLQDGKERWIAARGRVFYDGRGRAVRLVGTTLDISERKQAEEKIEELNSNLAARAAELAFANQELEAFNYTVAHDLRKPLTVVNGYCQALKEMCGNQLDVHCKEYLQEAYDGTLRMNQLIDALLNFSRMAHVELHRETVDLSGMAQLVAAELRLAEPGRRVTFLIADGVSADGDEILLRVVLVNLLGNAWKYTGTRDEGIIEFGTTEVDGKPACFVRDNGAGFDMADADKLFTPFQRLPGAEEFRGHGIGLATVERIISRHGGRVWAEGAPGKGATFYFTLSA